MRCGNDVMRRGWVERKGAKVALTRAGVGGTQGRRGAKVALYGEGKVGWGWVSGCGGAECGCVVDCWGDGACD